MASIQRTQSYAKTHFLFDPQVLIVFLVLGTICAGLIGVGSVLRIVFPALSFICGCYFLYIKRNDCFLQLILWLFMTTPLIRRLVDYTAGYQAVNTLMLAPYAVTSLVIPLVFDKLTRTQYFKYQMPFFLIAISIAYGLIVAIFNNHMSTGVYDAITWLSPVAVGLFILLDHENRELYRSTLTKTLLIGVPLMCVYAIYQFINPPRWDAYWMVNAGMGSIGIPAPYMVRVFGPMNSPGPFAQDLAFSLLIILSYQGNKTLKVIALSLGVMVILLSTVRTAWLGFACGIIYLMLYGKGSKIKSNTATAALVSMLVIPILFQIPQVNDLLSERFASFDSLNKDVSYEERSNGYVKFFTDTVEQSPFGNGFGSTGVRSGFVGGKENPIDSAFVEIGNILGISFGSVYLFGIFTVVAASIGVAKRNPFDNFTCACASVAFAATLMLTGGTTVAGECGIFFWIAVGLCLAKNPAAHIPVGLSKWHV